MILCNAGVFPYTNEPSRERVFGAYVGRSPCATQVVAERMSKQVQQAASSSRSSKSLTKGEIFDVLRNQRRRFVLQYLKQKEDPVELGDLATQVAAWEYDTTVQDVTSEQRKRVYTTLQQTHLDKMAEAGIVEYDADRGVIRSTDQTADLSIYLEIVPGREFPWQEYYLSLGAVSTALVTALWFNVYPFTMVSDLEWATLIALVLTLSATYHVYRQRGMRLDQPDGLE
ncbi:MAG: hypothetical protein ACI8VE_001398 [Natrialbaceae archaeon]|jgi:hypothetical protein